MALTDGERNVFLAVIVVVLVLCEAGAETGTGEKPTPACGVPPTGCAFPVLPRKKSKTSSNEMFRPLGPPTPPH